MIDITNTMIAIIDPAGCIRAGLSDRPQGPVVILYRPDGTPAAGVVLAEDDAVIVIPDSVGRMRTGVRLIDGEPRVFALDADGNPLVSYPVDDPPERRIDPVASRN